MLSIASSGPWLQQQRRAVGRFLQIQAVAVAESGQFATAKLSPDVQQAVFELILVGITSSQYVM